MKMFAESVLDFLKEEDGPTAVEYAVMLALNLGSGVMGKDETARCRKWRSRAKALSGVAAGWGAISVRRVRILGLAAAANTWNWAL